MNRVFALVALSAGSRAAACSSGCATEPGARLKVLRGGAAPGSPSVDYSSGLRVLLKGDLSAIRADSKATEVLWAGSAALYLGTLRWADARMRAAPGAQTPLADLGFDLFPRVDALAYVTDLVGSAMAAWTAWAFYRGSAAQQGAARYAVFCVGVGNLFSASLHTFTLIPSVDFASSDWPLMGGRSDKLMSNHAFCVGLFFQLCTRLGYCPRWAALLGVGLYSAAMLSTRAHYTVDIVLAWWALALASYFE